ncbi:DNA polymerase III subunit chi [Woodsholea maritima]|uniref:DNA polymerase III subunit chi n=1 Tax=Woodsholea maritima TaxID=240237 RepID=UPI00036C5F6C|nr:DNA polymerase III subunit chi [Woodsholea maritima]
MSQDLWFYHLTQSPVEEALPELLTKVLERGGRALVVSPDEGRMDALDSHLWTFRENSFLAHGREDRPMASEQPILLSHTGENLNTATMLFCIDGAEPLDGFERVVYMFDGNDAARLDLARAVWRRNKAAGWSVSYWQQSETGRWEKKA